jgi:hypothetical protein
VKRSSTEMEMEDTAAAAAAEQNFSTFFPYPR